MATLNFPDSPNTGDEYYDSNAGFNYEWNGTVWISKEYPVPNTNAIKEIDDISSGFDGSDTTFTLQVRGVNITPINVEQLVISVGGVMQNPGDDYTVSGSVLTFTTAPSSGLSFTGTFLGTAASLNTISAGTVSPSSLTTTSNYTVGSIKVSGASTIGNFVLTGITTVTDLDVTNFSSSGVGTISNVILTKDASGIGATVGAAVGVVTYYGNGVRLTGLGNSFSPTSYDPGISSTSIPVTTNITLDWNHPIKAGSGTITIRSGSASGTVVDQFVVGSSSSITIANNQLTLNPAADLSNGVEYFVTLPAASIKSYGDIYENEQIIYSFTTAPKLLFAWASNNQGQLGLNDTIQRSSPTQIPGTTWNGTMIGGSNGMGVKTDGSMWVWGWNSTGNLGQNGNIPTSVGRSSPIQLGTDTTWGADPKSIFVDKAMFNIKTDGTLWAWGNNDRGVLAQNQGPTYSPSEGWLNPGKRSSPTQIPGTTWSDISGSGKETIVAIKTDGTLWSWGYNLNGALGHNQAWAQSYGPSSPMQVGTDTNWSQVSASGPGHTTLGLKTDGTLWVWGGYYYGELGLNQTSQTKVSSPTQIPGTTWSYIGSGSYGDGNMAAEKSDGTLWVWGNNSAGDLGLNNLVRYSSPTQVPGIEFSKWRRARRAVFGIKTNGTLWSWGYNNAGHQANNSPAYLSSPTQIGTDSDWISVRPGSFSISAMRSG